MSSDLRALWKSAGGDAPQEWSIVPFELFLRDSKSIAVGVMYPGPDTPGGTPLLKVGDIKDGVVSERPTHRISAETNGEHQRTQLQGDELLITLVGEPGVCVVVRPEMAGWNPARAIAVVRLADPGLRTYLKAVLESSAGRHLIDAVLNTTVQKTLNLKDIRRLPIPLPPRSVIASISEISEALTGRIALLRESNATLEAIAQALFKSWFVDFDPVRAKQQGLVPAGIDEAAAALFPNSFEESPVGPVPKGWSIGQLISLCEAIFSGGTPDTRRSEYWSGNLRWFSSGETRESVVVDTEKRINALAVQNSSTRMSHPGDVMIASAGQGLTRGQTSYCAVDTYINQSVISVRTDSTKGHAAWTFYNLARRYEEMRSLSDSHKQGVAEGGEGR